MVPPPQGRDFQDSHVNPRIAAAVVWAGLCLFTQGNAADLLPQPPAAKPADNPFAGLTGKWAGSNVYLRENAAAPAVIDEASDDAGFLTIDGHRYSYEEVIERYPGIARALRLEERLRLRQAGKPWTWYETPPPEPASPGHEASPAARDRAARRALRYLRERALGGTLAAQPDPAVRIVNAAVVGLAFLAADGAIKGRNGVALQAVAELVGNWTGDEETIVRQNFSPKWDQRTWAYGHGAIFLAEYLAAGGTAATPADLQRYVDWIERAQSAAGGWGHHPLAKVCPHGYVEINCVTGLCVLALGFAERVGAKVAPATIDRGVDYMRRSTLPDGVVNYNLTRRGTSSPLRNASVALALLACKRSADPLYASTVNWYYAHLARVEDRPDSPLLGVFFGSLCAAVGGGEHWNDYWRNFGKALLERQDALGRFDPPNRFIIADQGDRATATQCLALLLPLDRLKLLTDLSGRQPGPPAEPYELPAVQELPKRDAAPELEERRVPLAPGVSREPLAGPELQSE